MKIQIVKTEQDAKELALMNLVSIDKVEHSSIQCECGETYVMVCINYETMQEYRVGICESCGE